MERLINNCDQILDKEDTDLIHYFIRNSDNNCIFDMLNVYVNHYPKKVALENKNGVRHH